MAIGLEKQSDVLPVGLHRGIPSEQYHCIDALSSHRLKTLAQSPAHLRWELDNPAQPTEAMVTGSALHTAILEPQLFDELYAVAPECDRRTTVGKQIWAEFVRANDGKALLTDTQYARITGMAKSIRAHELASSLIELGSETEVTGIWIDEETGTLCKLRADAYSNLVATVYDVKTTEDASRRSFERSIFNFGYHQQAALYVDGLRKLGLTVEHYTIIAVEKSAPHGVAVYRLLEDTLRLGRELNRGLISLYAACVRTNQWPAYPAAVQDIGIPTWAKRQIEEEVRA